MEGLGGLERLKRLEGLEIQSDKPINLKIGVNKL